MAKETKLMQKEDFKYTVKGSSLWGVLLFVILLLIDQVTKLVADAYFSAAGAEKTISIIPGWIELCQHYNKGVAFSGLNDAAPWVKILLIIGTAALMTLFAIFYFKMDKRRSFLRWTIVFIVAGGVGNLIDRLYFKMWLPDAPFGVRDMVRVDLQIFDFGVCNFADFFISAGAVMLIIAIIFFDTDSFIPLGKYKVLAEEAEAARKAKEEAKKGGANKENKESTIAGAPKQEGKRTSRELVWVETGTNATENAGAQPTQSVSERPAQPAEENAASENKDSVNNG